LSSSLMSITAILTLSPGQLPPIQSWKRSNDFVKEFLGRDTSRVLKKSLKVADLGLRL